SMVHLADACTAQLHSPGIEPTSADLPAYVDDRLVERIPERIGRVAADQNGAGLGHEASHVSSVAGYRDRAALERDAGPGRRVTLDHDQAASGRRADALRRIALHPDSS